MLAMKPGFLFIAVYNYLSTSAGQAAKGIGDCKSPAS